ncbi:UTP--glucose-1-phosphate uridylyltransferase 3, chloroplastic [Selaginella moellendorffii]|uniref:UTP--glucose-1-phosphate uridylyltransferase 3, chloroplastic n=1 Tax=Selaginella moellendorffii TaxID=88036 RepID=UPI000D1C7CF8|nr:UTP--glucose-1-phosphate uridylyltransferase 3, chloroplastic [Selaginella moellendorffii]|eukprot:XP_024518512.1 UTP--glucose-1-phosphate uridylyltransferase 3, chloroplastic [Selaginella moellendorffii]
MEALTSAKRSFHGNAVVTELCGSLETSLLLRPRPESVILDRDGSRSRNFRSHRKLVSKCRTLSPISEKNAVCNGGKGSSSLSRKNWRLEEELERLTDLKARLKACKSLRERCLLVGSLPRVQAVFSFQQGSLCNEVVAVAMRKLGDYELYLLKCLVAIGQGHILGLGDEGGGVADDHRKILNGCNGLGGMSFVNGSEKSVLMGTLQLMTQLIESFEDAKSSELIQWPLSLDVTAELQRKRRRGEPDEREVLLKLKSFVRVLDSLERFYDCIGGIVGYQLAGMELIRSSETGEIGFSATRSAQQSFYHVPEGKDLSKDTAFATQAAGWGVKRLAEIGEIYPLGGAGDRLGLVDDVTGESLPVAMLPYCGRTLLEGLIRDLQAREFFHFKLYGSQVITPVAIMTSAAKRNNERVKDLLESHRWFGRGRDNFQLFEQPLVPTIAAENVQWVVRGPLDPMLKPGGHGVIWKLAKDSEVFKWFYDKNRKAAVVRQISNPVAATDVTLLALAGVGLHQNKKFGFASCDRKVGAAEGVNVLMESKTEDGRWRYGTTCIEYTEFSRLGIADVPVSTGSMQARFPANTNVLFVDLESVEEVASRNDCASLPGMIMNLKKPVTFTDSYGVDQSIRAGRIECTMQNIADSLQNHYQHQLTSIDHDNLDTFIIYNQRRKVTSSAKRRRKLDDQTLHQTPDGSFLDITRNAFDLLTSCGVAIDEMESNQCYIDTGPPFIALLHPAIGPLWNIFRQKIYGGSIRKGSEVQLEISELSWTNVDVSGSLVVEAENIMGTVKDGILHYGEGLGRCRFHNVQVSNQGIDWKCSTNVYWQNKVSRHESLKIILKGCSEFDASDVVIKGSHVFEVPDGHKMRVRPSGPTGFSCTLERLPESSRSWAWKYAMRENGEVELEMVGNSSKTPQLRASFAR